MTASQATGQERAVSALRILYLSPYYWPEEIGSSAYCTDLALWLKDHGHDVRVVAFRPHYPKPEQFAAWTDGSRDEETEHGIPISRVAVDGRGGGGFKDRIKNDLKYLWSVVSSAVRGRFRGTDVVVAYVPSILTLYAALAVRLLTGARTIGVVHDIESGLASSLGLANSKALLFVMRLVERFGLNRVHEVVVLTEGMAEELRDIGCKRPIHVLSIWAEVAPRVELEAGKAATILYSGNFGKKQNLDQLLPLIERLDRERPDIRVVFRGDGSEKARLMAEVEGRGLSNTTFVPLVPADQFVSALQEASVHLVPQALNVANYALPSKLFSIMSVGRPHVCIAETGSPLDLLTRKSGGGICVQPGDEDALFRAVADLADDVARLNAMGDAGRAFVTREMNRATILAAYEEIIAGRGGAGIGGAASAPAKL